MPLYIALNFIRAFNFLPSRERFIAWSVRGKCDVTCNLIGLSMSSAAEDIERPMRKGLSWASRISNGRFKFNK